MHVIRPAGRSASLGAMVLSAAMAILVPVLARTGIPGAGVRAGPVPETGPSVPVGDNLKIVKPRPVEIVSGEQTIEIALNSASEASEPEAIEVLVDGRVIARVDHPPYRATFDFGQSLAARVIAARIASGPAAGRTTEITTRGFDPRRIDDVARVNLVTLYVSVRTASGKYVTDLPRERFSVYEGTTRQKIALFEIEKRPLVAAILLDVSFSMKGEPIEAAREAATRFVRSLATGDRAMVIAFSDEPRVLIEPTADKDRLAAVIKTIEAKGGTALYDAIYAASDRLSREDGRKVIVLLSDGRDEAQSGVEPGSLHTFEEALEKALRSEAILFTIGFGKQVEKETDFYGRTPLKEILDRLASDSGGAFYYSQRAGQLKGVYDLIGEELRNQYSLAYAPAVLRADGAWHPIRVDIQDRSLRVFTRRGYYAPKS